MAQPRPMPPQWRHRAWRCCAIAFLLPLSACSTLRLHGAGALPRGLELDGLVMVDRASNTTREVLSMLGLEAACASPGQHCGMQLLETPGTVREGTRLVAAADVFYRAARHHRATRRSASLHACAKATHHYLYGDAVDGREGPLSARSQLALRLHNACTAEIALDVLSDEGVDGLDWDVAEIDFPREAIHSVTLATQVRMHGLRTRQVEDGVGVAAIASGRVLDPVGTFPAQPFALAINLLLEPTDGGRLRLVARDASRSRSTATAFGRIPLARDMSAAYAMAALAFEEELGSLRALFGAKAGRDDSQIRLLSPVDRDKTPVVLIHGFASSPMAWANMVNELLGDPDIAAHYQFWMARYATGYPVLVNRQQMAGTIAAFRARALGHHARCRPAMLVGHSMGGVIARLLVTRSDHQLWDAAFVVSPETLSRSPDALLARELFIFDAIPDADELVMIAAPHDGSDKAASLTARLVRRFIRLPAEATGYLRDLAIRQPQQLRAELLDSYRNGGIDSLATLSPGQPVMRTARQLPVAAGVAIHSIIGVRDPRNPAQGDGIVSLASATWPAGDIHQVAAGHDLQAAPATISILKRILLDRLQRPATNPNAHTVGCE